MLKAPYKKYKDLHIYNIDSSEIEISDNDLIGIWKEENTALIFFHKNKDELFKELEKKGIRVLFYNKIPYHYWESGKFIKSFKIGNILIKPEWEKADNDNLNNTIYIDPSVAFGSGFHPTTKMILRSFYNLNKKEKFVSCADLGCGTGILSIFAAKLGLKKIIAIDNNNLAVEVTKKNIEINQLKNIVVIEDDIFNRLPLKVDIIFANLYYHLLEELFKKDTFWSARYYFLSGFVKEMEKRIIKKIPKHVDIVVKKEEENWIMMVGKLKG